MLNSPNMMMYVIAFWLVASFNFSASSFPPPPPFTVFSPSAFPLVPRFPPLFPPLPRFSKRQRFSSALFSDAASRPSGTGSVKGGNLNELQTLLNCAVKAEDYALAAELRDAINELTSGDAKQCGRFGNAKDWEGLGVDLWLAKR